MSNKLSTTLMGAAAVAMTLSACSSEDTVINEPRAMKEISFNVTANRPTRALAYYNSKEDVTRFKVSAWVNKNTSDQTAGISKAYFESEVLTLNTTDSKWVYDDNHIRYWPNNGETLDFYAWVDNKKNAAVAASEGTSAVEANESLGYTFSWTGTNKDRATLTDIEQKNANGMVDLLYANEFGKKQSVNVSTGEVAGSDKVDLKMNHAFAQVGVVAKVVNPKIQVQVTEVKLVNLIDKGDFMFATKDNATDAEDKAQWTVTPTLGNVSVTAAANNTTIVYAETDNNGVNLTTNGSVKNTFMVLPYSKYSTAAENETSITVNSDKEPTTGTYIGLKCKIWNIANPKATVNLDNELLIYGTSTEYKYLYIPVALNTEMGKNYTYTITFGTGHAGFNEEGQNTLVKIDWNVISLDDWDSVPATGTDEKIEQ